ncbi:MAG: hypothetical protein ACRDRN_23810, partial [Sciscionella sp.]
ADKAEVYRELGVRLTYNHTEHTVLAETRPTSPVCGVSVSEGDLRTNHPHRPRPACWTMIVHNPISEHWVTIK